MSRLFSAVPSSAWTDSETDVNVHFSFQSPEYLSPRLIQRLGSSVRLPPCTSVSTFNVEDVRVTNTNVLFVVSPTSHLVPRLSTTFINWTSHLGEFRWNFVWTSCYLGVLLNSFLQSVIPTWREEKKTCVVRWRAYCLHRQGWTKTSTVFVPSHLSSSFQTLILWYSLKYIFSRKICINEPCKAAVQSIRATLNPVLLWSASIKIHCSWKNIRNKRGRQITPSHLRCFSEF